MTAISTWVFVRAHIWKCRLLIVHSAGLIYCHWQTRNIDSQKYQWCSYKAIYYYLFRRVSYGRAIMHCTRGDINLKSTKNEHCTHTLKSTSQQPISHDWVVKNIMCVIFLLFRTAKFSRWNCCLAFLVNFVIVLLIKLIVIQVLIYWHIHCIIWNYYTE